MGYLVKVTVHRGLLRWRGEARVSLNARLVAREERHRASQFGALVAARSAGVTAARTHREKTS